MSVVSCSSSTAGTTSASSTKTSAEEENLKKIFTSATAILKLYKADLDVSALGHLKVKEIAKLAKTVLLLIPLKNDPKNAQDILSSFFLDLPFGNHSKHAHDGLSSFLLAKANRKERSCYASLWEDCEASAIQKANSQRDIARILAFEGFKHSSDQPLIAACPSHIQRQTNLDLIASIARDCTQLLGPFWRKIQAELTPEITEYQENIKECKNSQQESNTSYALAMHTYYFASRSLKNLQTSISRLFHINQRCALLNTLPVALHLEDRLAALGKSCLGDIQQTVTSLNEMLGRHEAWVALTTGVEPVSASAITFLDSIASELDAVRVQTTQDIKDYLDGIYHLESSFKEIAVSYHQRVDFFQRLQGILADGVMRSSSNNIATNEPIENLLDMYLKQRKLYFEKILKILNPARQENKHARLLLSKFAKIFKMMKDTGEKQFQQKDTSLYLFFYKLSSRCRIVSTNRKYCWNLNTLKSVYKSVAEEANKKSAVRQRTLLSQKQIDEEEVGRTASLIRNLETLKQSVSLVAEGIFSPLQSVNFFAMQEREKKASFVLDDFLRSLQVEEEAELLKNLCEKTEKADKETNESSIESSMDDLDEQPALAIANIASAPEELPPPDFIASTFNTPSAKLVFDLLHYLKEWHFKDSPSLIPPSRIPLRASNDVLAVHQQLYALSCFANALEILESVSNASHRACLVQFACLFGHQFLEQGLAEKLLKSYPQAFPSHSLREMLAVLEIQMNQNLWLDHVDAGTLFHRYTWNIESNRGHPFSFALRHIRENNPKTTNEFCEGLSAWVATAVEFNIVILSQNCPAERQGLLRRIQSTYESFQKAPVGSTAKATAEQAPLSRGNADALTKWENSLTQDSLVLIDARLKHLGAVLESRDKALLNARNHLTNLINAIGLLKQAPQQRFLHFHLVMLLISTQYFVENIGVHLKGLIGHDLTIYALEEGLEKQQIEMLGLINVQKGSEYPFSYFAHRPGTVLMDTLSELYMRSYEATFLGDGAVPSGMASKSLAQLQKIVSDYGVSFAKLIHALMRKHLSDSNSR